MKKNLIFVMIAVAVIAAFSGCTKTVTVKAPTTTTTTTYSMTADIGGTSFSATNCQEGGASNYYLITGNSTTGAQPSIVLYITEPSGSALVGTYTINGTTMKAYYYPNAANTGLYKIAASGTITISSVTPAVSVVGTFHFTCDDGTLISGGQFTAKP